MMLIRTDPFRELDRLTQQLLGTTTRPTAMPMDAYESDGSFLIRLDLPGISPESIDLNVEQNVLTVKAERPAPEIEGREMVIAERPYGVFSRQVFLGETLAADKIEADYDAGVLTIRIPMAEHAKPRKIEIKSSSEKKQITT
ncbi:Hsp20/alpha crystallin family protein [Kitasatospora cathayae]|uniref:Hsp20/alpha crystallin family protein n=2 Tax=Kitasatospora cathayae TaxID=3004092 RepID=A0ABY7PVF3_9ACTN|nr:Hsp20/alpha crystallin family protein [Kitasatospora sp. HUAS 3-15]WBP84403.1 Hsp20/alpha crystallin family protein [Kitasatospora sp. HUAS 3-15]